MPFPVSRYPWQLQALPQQWQHECIFLLVLLLLPVLSLFLARHWKWSSSKKGHGLHMPPCPPGLPVIGNLHQIGALPHQSLWELARRHGPAVMMLRLGRVRTVVVSSPEAARDVLQTHDIHSCSRPDTPGPRRVSYQHNDLAFTPYNEHWRQMRKLFVVEFRSKRLTEAIRDARETEVDKLIRNLTAAVGGPVFLEDHIFGCMDGIIGTVAFGNIYGMEHFTDKQQFHHVFDEAMITRSSFSAEDYFPNLFGRLIDRLTGVVSQRERVFREFDAFFETILEHHLDPSRAVPKNGGDYIDDLIEVLLRQDQLGSSVRNGRERIKGLLSNTYLGAVDTSSVTTVWAMAELVRKPQLLRKVQDEIRNLVGSKKMVEQDDLPSLKYLKMVVIETLRLHPPLPLLVPRETMEQIKISGHDVPAKTRLIVNAWAIGRDPASWDRPVEFDPDRFEGKDVKFDRTCFEFVPFGAGRRMCPGMAIGLATTELVLANLLYCFDWGLPKGVTIEDISMEEAGGHTLHKKTPLVLVPTRYKCQD